MKTKGKLKRNEERYLVDYVKFLLKAKQVQADVKFRAFLLLKDLVNNRHKKLIDYTEKKILRRLYEFARSEFKGSVLLQIEPTSDPKISADFYQVVLECLDNWGVKYGATNAQYSDKRTRLISERILPVKTSLINFPGPDEEYIFDDGINTIEEDIRSLLTEVKTLREQITSKVLQTKAANLKTRDVEQLVNAYRDAYERLDRHPDKINFVNDMANCPNVEAIKDDLLNELIYYQSFSELYTKAVGLESNKAFYIEFKDLNRNFFDNDLNIEPCLIPEVKPPSMYEAKDVPNYNDSFDGNPYEHNIYQDARITEQPKALKPDIDNNVAKINDDHEDYNYNGFKIDDNEDYSYDMNNEKHKSPSLSRIQALDNKNIYQRSQNNNRIAKISAITQENHNLNNDIEQLERQRRELAKRIKDIEEENIVRKSNLKSTNYISTPVRDKLYANEGLMNIMKNKDEHIQNLQEKIKKIEDENMKVNEPDEDMLDIRAVGINDYKLKNRSRSNIHTSIYRSEPKTANKSPHGPYKSETSGTEFVNQMYSNINKLLHKPTNKHASKNLNFVY